MAEQIEFDQAHQTLQEVSEALENGRFVYVRRQLQDMEPEDIAHLLEASPRKSREVLWQLTDPEDYGEILDELNEDVKDSLVSKMAPEKLAEATEGMDTDDVAYVYVVCLIPYRAKSCHKWTPQTVCVSRLPFLTQKIPPAVS